MKKITAFLLLAFIATTVIAQDPPFWKDIQNFKAKDSAKTPPKNAIVFTGSSSFTKWTNVQDMFPGYAIINRGFGGSSLPDVIRYANDVIFKYQPKQVIIYCGENDIAGNPDLTADSVANRFITLFTMIRKRLPKASIAFVSMKPSPSRAKFRSTVEEANTLIRDYIKTKKDAAYIDVYPKMLNHDGSPIGSLFTQDSLHMNQSGYDIWQKVIKPYLKG